MLDIGESKSFGYAVWLDTINLLLCIETVGRSEGKCGGQGREVLAVVVARNESMLYKADNTQKNETKYSRILRFQPVLTN